MKAKTGEGCDFVKKGTVLLTAKPFAFILKSKFQGQRCDFCFQRFLLKKFHGQVFFINMYLQLILQCSSPTLLRMFVRVLLWPSMPKRRFVLILFPNFILDVICIFFSLGNAQWRVQRDEKGCSENRS